MSSAWTVHKFGGTSLADADRYRQVAEILRSEPCDPAGACSVAIQSYPRAHASIGTSGSDNIVACTTARDQANSLVVLVSYLGDSAS